MLEATNFSTNITTASKFCASERLYRASYVWRIRSPEVTWIALLSDAFCSMHVNRADILLCKKNSTAMILVKILGAISYLLTPWCRVLLEKLTGLQLVKKFPAFHGTRKFITALTSVRHLSLSWASPIQSIYQHPTWRSILILSTHLCLSLASGLPSGFPSKTLYTPLSSLILRRDYMY